MLRRSFLKGVGALFALSTMPALSSHPITVPNILRYGHAAIQLRCKDGTARWFIVPARRERHYINKDPVFPEMGVAQPRLILPYVQMSYHAQTIVDLEKMVYTKRRDDNVEEGLALVDRLAIANAPVLERDDVFVYINKYSNYRFTDPRERMAKLNAMFEQDGSLAQVRSSMSEIGMAGQAYPLKGV